LQTALLDDDSVENDPSRAEQELEFRKRLGRRIRTLRLERGLNQDDFADRSGIHRTHVGMLENARLDPKLSTLHRVAGALGLPVSELLKVNES
jgi:transcriptional regulator with XRE-family HTH domain